MILVIDASVIIKWLFQDPEREADTEQATALMAAVARGDLSVVQPPHWLIEVAADDRYHRKAKGLPGIRYLRDWDG